MISENMKILAHRAIDGELSAAETEDFEQLLSTSTEMRQFYSQLEALAALPSHLPSVEPPAGLKSEITSAIAPSRRIASVGHKNPRSIGALIGNLLTPRLAYGLAAGLVVGIGLGAVAFNSYTGQLNPLELSGTVIGGKSEKSLIRVDADSFGDGQAVGRLAVDAGSGLTYVQLELQSSQEVSVVLEFDPVGYSIRAFEQQTPHSGIIVSGEGQLTASHVGENRYLFVLGTVAESDSPVVVRVESTGVIYRRELKLN